MTHLNFEIANALADDLAEDILRSNMGDMYVTNASERAKEVRQLSEAKTDVMNKAVQEYRNIQGIAYAVVCRLADGYGDYLLVNK